MPDFLHFQPEAFEHPLYPIKKSAVACSAIIDKDPQEGFVFARNMDWLSFGLSGTYSLVINRLHDNGRHNTLEVSVPGFVGTLTGMNDQGLSLAMNVCAGKTKTIRGMPASFYNRACLERCQSIEEVEAFANKMSPLGPYHLTISDPKKAQTIHFYQPSSSGSHLIRHWEESKPLVTLNCRYNPSPYYAMHFSEERQEVIHDFFSTPKRKIFRRSSLPSFCE